MNEVADLVGQCLMVGIRGPELAPEDVELLTAERIGAVCLFSRNLGPVAASAALCRSLQDVARERLAAPLLLATDQEGGAVQRLTEGATPLPSAMALGAAGTDATRAVATVCGRELRAVGIDMTLAPVLDVNREPSNPVVGTRSYGDRPEHVAACGIAAVQGLHEAGCAAVAKHFPGHGDCSVDSHLALPVLAHDRERLERVELVPFRTVLEAGVDGVMTGHLAVPALDPTGTPASLSRALTGDLLRKRLGHRGLVMTDCLEMAGAGGDDIGERAVQALLAGADLVLVSHTPELQRRAAAGLREAVAAGRLPLERLREAAGRVLALKRRLAGERPSLEVVGCRAHRAVVRDAAERAVVVIRRRQLPGRLAGIAFGGPGLSRVEEAGAADPLLQALADRGLPTLALSLNPGSEELAPALLLAADADGLVIGTRRLTAFPGQERAVHALVGIRPAAVVALREPYDLGRVPGAAVLVAAWGDVEPLVAAALSALLDGRAAPDRLALKVSGL